jgi:hypothetical protein
MISSKLRNVLVSPVFWISFALAGSLLSAFVYHFVNAELIRNNLGERVLWVELAVSGATVVLGGLFFGLTVYKIGYFSHAAHSGKSGAFGAAGSFLSVVVTGCPACSITVASYLGLSSLFAGLPFLGYEVRIFGLAVMLGATAYTWRHLETCALPKSPKRR